MEQAPGACLGHRALPGASAEPSRLPRLVSLTFTLPLSLLFSASITVSQWCPFFAFQPIVCVYKTQIIVYMLEWKSYFSWSWLVEALGLALVHFFPHHSFLSFLILDSFLKSIFSQSSTESFFSPFPSFSAFHAVNEHQSPKK